MGLFLTCCTSGRETEHYSLLESPSRSTSINKKPILIPDNNIQPTASSNPIVQSTMELDTEYEEDENVRLQIKGCSTWLESSIIEILPNNKYRVRIYRGMVESAQKIIGNDYIRIVNENKLRKASKMVQKITYNTPSNANIIDLYLNGKNAQNELREISKTIQIFYNKDLRRFSDKMEYITARYISLLILEYCINDRYHWRVSCLWCDKLNVFMNRNNARSHLIAAGAIVGNYASDYNLMAFCDLCNFELHYDDITYRCSNQTHDICIKCLNGKINEYNKLNDILTKYLSFMDIYSLQCIVEYTVGGLRKFDNYSD